MIRTAIVEDDTRTADTLEAYLNRFSGETGETFLARRFSDPIGFLERYAGYDLVLMDIEMPNMDGMEAARRLREIDRNAKLVFVTNMAQYAAKGYEVDALDFMVKPVAYSDLAFKMRRGLSAIRAGRRRELTIQVPGGIVRENSDELLYIEVVGHTVSYHFLDHVVEARGSITAAEESLKEMHLLRPHNSFLINPRFIERVQGYAVLIGGQEIMISRNRRREFMQALGDWYAKGGA